MSKQNKETNLISHQLYKSETRREGGKVKFWPSLLQRSKRALRSKSARNRVTNPPNSSDTTQLNPKQFKKQKSPRSKPW